MGVKFIASKIIGEHPSLNSLTTLFLCFCVISSSSCSYYPTSGKLTFYCGRGGVASICTMNVDGTDQVELSDKIHEVVGAPTWSPDGGLIAYSIANEAGHLDIQISTADGSNVTRLTKDDHDDIDPKWSPDG